MRIGNTTFDDADGGDSDIAEIRLGSLIVWQRAAPGEVGELVISVDGFLVIEPDGYLVR